MKITFHSDDNDDNANDNNDNNNSNNDNNSTWCFTFIVFYFVLCILWIRCKE